MLFRTILPSLAVLALLHGASASTNTSTSPQTTTVLPFGVINDFDSGYFDASGYLHDSTEDLVIPGAIIGTGVGGTTYVLTDGDAKTGEQPATITLIENASQATAYGSSSSKGLVDKGSGVCEFHDGMAECTYEYTQVKGWKTSSQSFTSSGVASSLVVALSTSTTSSAGKYFVFNGLLGVGGGAVAFFLTVVAVI